MRFTEPVCRPGAAAISAAPHRRRIIAKAFRARPFGLDDFISKSFSTQNGASIETFSGAAAVDTSCRRADLLANYRRFEVRPVDHDRDAVSMISISSVMFFAPSFRRMFRR